MPLQDFTTMTLRQFAAQGHWDTPETYAKKLRRFYPYYFTAFFFPCVICAGTAIFFAVGPRPLGGHPVFVASFVAQSLCYLPLGVVLCWSVRRSIEGCITKYERLYQQQEDNTTG